MSTLTEWLAEQGNSMRDNNEKRILDAIQTSNVNVLKEILENPVDCRLGYQDTPIFSVAALSGDCDMVNYLIASGCDSANVDKMGRTALDMLLRGNKFDLTDDGERRRLKMINILLATYPNAVETVFLNANQESKESPFLLACHLGSDAIIMRFLDLLGNNNSIPMDHVIGYEGDNLFHYLLDYVRYDSPSSRLETVKTVIDKFPYSHQLIDAKNNYGMTPLHMFLRGNRGGFKEMINLLKLFFQHGASPDAQEDKSHMTYLDRALCCCTASVVETILRAGCRTDSFLDPSPLSDLLQDCDKSRISKIELLLAFGYDLQKELFLYTIDERPIEFTSPEFVDRCDTSGMNLDLLEALRELRRSNKLLSLQRQCRNTIRRHLKGKADEVIRNLTCIPPPVKSFLLVENETPLLEISELAVDDEEDEEDEEGVEEEDEEEELEEEEQEEEEQEEEEEVEDEEEKDDDDEEDEEEGQI